MADRIRLLCSVITKAARADLQTRLDKGDSGIGAIEHGVLRHLARGVDSMAEISRLMGVAPSTLVYVVDGLVRKKLVKRGKDPNDRRGASLCCWKRRARRFSGRFREWMRAVCWCSGWRRWRKRGDGILWSCWASLRRVCRG